MTQKALRVHRDTETWKSPPERSHSALRLIESASETPQSRRGIRRKAADPSEKPVPDHCGLCGHHIEGRIVSERRTSGLNLCPQRWFYHEMCWKQLQRMRRIDGSGWEQKRAVLLESRYRASLLDAETGAGFKLSELGLNLTG